MTRLNIDTDFSRYLLDTNLCIHHRVKVFIDNTMLECNGAILSNHSPVLQETFVRGDELYLDEFTGLLHKGVMDCLTLLYGGKANITIDNIQTIFKFAVIYQVHELFAVCLTWVLENITPNNFHQIYKIAMFIDAYKRDNTSALLEVCTGYVIHHPHLAIEEFDGEFSQLVNVIIDKTILHETLPIIIGWVDSSEKVEFIIDKVERIFSDIHGHKLLAVGLIEKMSDHMTHLETCKRVINIHKQLLHEREPEELLQEREPKRTCSASIPSSSTWYTPPTRTEECSTSQNDYDRSSYLANRTNYLKEKKWRYCTKNSIKQISSPLITCFVYAEIVLDWIEFSRPDSETVDDLWKSMNSVQLSKGYLADIKDHILLKFGYRMIPPKALQYQMSRCYFSITKDQKRLLLENECILLMIADCLVGSCCQDKRRVLTFQLCDDTPCYVLSGNKSKLPGAVCHWFIGISSDKKLWSVLSLVSHNRAEIGRALEGVSYEDIFLNCLIVK